MYMKLKSGLLIFAVIFLVACSMSTEDLAEEVKANMEQNFKGENIQIESLILTKKGGNEYKGILTTKEPGGNFSYTVEVIYDGDYITWEVIR